MKRAVFSFALTMMSIIFIWNTVAAEYYVIPVGSVSVGTKISSLPCTISTPGFYYLTRNLTSEGTGITVSVDNVTIDLMGFVLTGPGSGTYSGITMNDRSNVEIRNGTVTNFYRGVAEVNAGKNHRVTNIRVSGNKSAGIFLTGYGNLVKDCTASENEGEGIVVNYGSTLVNNTAYGNGDDGISVWQGCTVIGNTTHSNWAYGINIRSGANLVDRNTAYNNNQSGEGYTNISSCSTCTFGLNHAP